MKRVGRECGDEFVVAWLCKQLHEYVKTLSTADQLSTDDIQNLALVIYSAYSSLNLAEVMLFFSRLAAGIYGIVGYNSVRGENITARIRQFLEDRRRELDRYERQREEQQRRAEEERRKLHAVDYSTYKSLLAKLAAERFAGDEDAARAYLAAHPREFDAHGVFSSVREKLSRRTTNAADGETNRQCAIFSAIISNKKHDTQKENPETGSAPHRRTLA